MSIRHPVENRYNPADWEIDPDSWLWRPSTKFAGLGDGYGTTKARSSGPGNVTGTLTNMDPATDWVHDPYMGRNVLAFDGISKYVAATSPISDAVSTYTMSVWVKVLTSATDDYVMSLGSSASATPAACLVINAGSQARVFMRGATALTNLYATGITTGQWFRWTLMVNGSSYRSLWINAIKKDETTTDIGAAAVNILSLGCFLRATPAYYSHCQIADPLIINGILTAPQIRQLASRRPDMDGLIRFKYEIPIPATTETPSGFKPFWARNVNTLIGGVC